MTWQNILKNGVAKKLGLRCHIREGREWQTFWDGVARFLLGGEMPKCSGGLVCKTCLGLGSNIFGVCGNIFGGQVA